jgi:hypothetical protein
MRKHIALGVALLFATFMVAAMAQTSGSSSGQYGSSSGQMGASTAKTRTIEGCIAQEGSDFFLVPRRGNPLMLQSSGTENPSAHVGHEVKITGSESSLSAASKPGAAGGTAGMTAQNPSTGSSQTGTSGTVGSSTNPSAPSAAAGGTENELHNLANRQLSVDKIAMVSETCPANWNPKVKSPGGTGGTGNPPSSTNPPPLN